MSFSRYIRDTGHEPATMHMPCCIGARRATCYAMGYKNINTCNTKKEILGYLIISNSKNPNKHLVKPCVSKVDIQIATFLFVKFAKDMESNYGSKYITPNMHLMIHLDECVFDYGSVYSFWLFAFERYNFLSAIYIQITEK